MKTADILEKDAKKLHELLLKEAMVGLVEGELFRSAGEGFQRINIAAQCSLWSRQGSR
jgi:bifunctional pyridoxal-dependent enzyme with beta-cystathionase and maltose regulon repressor activities